MLESIEVATDLAGSRMDVNERLPASTRKILAEMRRAMGEGLLHRDG